MAGWTCTDRWVIEWDGRIVAKEGIVPILYDLEKLNFTTSFAAHTAIPNKINLYADAVGFGVSLNGLDYTTVTSFGHNFYDGTRLLTKIHPAVIDLTNIPVSGANITDIETNTVHAELVHERVFNNAGSTLTAGTAVYVSGYNAGQDAVQVKRADADNPSTMPAIGIIGSDISSGGIGEVVQSGIIENLDTSSWSVGDQLYVSTTAGVLTNIRPTATNTEVQKMGVVIRSHASQGRIFVFGAGRTNDIPNDIVLNDISDVSVTDAAKGDIFYFDGTNWANLANDGGESLWLNSDGAGNTTWASLPVAATPTWATVLSSGNTTTGNNPLISTNDQLRFRDSTVVLTSPSSGTLKASMANLTIVASNAIVVSGASIALSAASYTSNRSYEPYSFALNTTHQAISSAILIQGTVECFWGDNDNHAYITFKTDSNNPPTTSMAQVGTKTSSFIVLANDIVTQAFPFTFHVNKGDYYRLDSTTSGGATVTLTYANVVNI